MTARMEPTQADRFEALRAIARRIPGAMPVLRGLHRMLDPELRSIARARHLHARDLLQPYPTTCPDRYPDLFDALATRLAARTTGLAEPRLLSFGCASGDEVRALRLRLPEAHITGLDLNARALASARRIDASPRSRYVEAGAPDPHDRYDAVLALAVFRHGRLEDERPESCAHILPFARFADGLARLDAVLVPGGWLALGHAHFRFADTALAARYQPDDAVAMQTPHVLYGPDDRRLGETVAQPVLFRKLR